MLTSSSFVVDAAPACSAQVLFACWTSCFTLFSRTLFANRLSSMFLTVQWRFRCFFTDSLPAWPTSRVHVMRLSFTSRWRLVWLHGVFVILRRNFFMFMFGSKMLLFFWRFGKVKFGDRSATTTSLIGNGCLLILVLVHNIVTAIAEVFIAIHTEDVDTMRWVAATRCLSFA